MATKQSIHLEPTTSRDPAWAHFAVVRYTRSSRSVIGYYATREEALARAAAWHAGEVA